MNKKFAFDNRLCYERDVLRQHALHHQKLQTMLPTCASPSKVYLDSNAPPRRAHVATNRKKLQLEKERQTEIYSQNQRLAAKMVHILNRHENAVLAAGTPGAAAATSPRSPTKPAPQPHKPVHSPAYVHMPGIRLNASQTPMVDCYLSPEYAMGRGNACKKTTLVNRGVQRQRQQQIENENRRLQDRLKAQKTYYNTKKWDSDWQQAGAKFQHLHQDATVGHLLPKTSHGTTSSTAAQGSPTRSPLAASRRIKTRDGLPSLKPKTSHGTSRGGRLQQKLEGCKPPSSGVPPATQLGPAEVLAIEHSDYDENCEGGDEYDEPEIADCGAFALLEATTRKGVELGIEELQVEMRDAASGCTQPGDRGLLVRGRWGSDVETEIVIAIDTLARIAQEIDDLEMMIKLETVSTLPDGSNFPRLSVLLTDDELQRLLLKLVQVLDVKLSEDETQLQIASRLLRPPSPSTRDDKPRSTCRPRTCPSTLPSESHAPFEFVHAASPDQGEEPTVVEVLLDAVEDETQQYHHELCKQLAELLNESARRTGFRACSGSRGLYLLQFWLHAQDAELHVTLLSLSPGGNEPLCAAIPLDGAQIVAMLEQIQHRGVSPVQAARRFVRGWLAGADKSEDTDQ